MKIFISIAWRNIWRNKRRSLLTISMVAFGLFLSILSESLAYGTHEVILRDAVDLHIGSIQIHAKDYQENKTLNYLFAPTDEIKKAISEEKDIKAWAPRIFGGGMVSVKDNTNIAVIIGIDPEKEAALTTFEEKIINGEKLKKKFKNVYKDIPLSRFLSSEPKLETIIGDKLAEKLEAKIDDKIAVMVQGADGSIGNDLYTIVGVYHTGDMELDNGINIHIADAEELFATYGSISELVIRTTDSRVIPQVVNNLKQKLDPTIYEVLSWKEISPELFQYMELDSLGNYLFFLILLVVVSFGILNTVFITIMERIREFGLLKSLGTTPLQIFTLIIAETLFLTLIGLVIGNILGACGAYYFQTNPIDLSSMSELYEEWGISMNYMTAEFAAYYFIDFSIVVFILAFIASLYPAIKAARLEPVQALKHI